MRYRYRPKTSKSEAVWEQVSSDVRKQPTQDWCEFYTPLGRMVSKPAGKKPYYMDQDEWCAAKTPFKNLVVDHPRKRRRG